MKVAVLVAIFSLAVVAVNNVGANDIGVDVQDIQPRALTLLGSSAGANAKFLYVDSSQSLTWSAAKSYCSGITIPVNMRIASVFPADYTFLTTAPVPTVLGPGKVYWTAGRDLEDWPQFRWDNAADFAAFATITDPSALPFYRSGVRTCVSFLIMSDGITGRLASADCQTKYPVLCQSPAA